MNQIKVFNQPFQNILKALTYLIGSTLLTSIIVTNQVLAEDNYHYDYGTVLTSKPVYRIFQMSGQEKVCTEEIVNRRTHTNSGGSLVGGIIGAAIGHAIGHKVKHKTGATIAGAIIGSQMSASASNSSNFDGSSSNNTEYRCKMVPTSWEEERIIGYNVVYRYDDQTIETRLPFEPKDSIKLRVMLTPIDENSENLR